MDDLSRRVQLEGHSSHMSGRRPNIPYGCGVYSPRAPCGTSGKEPSGQCRDAGLIPGSEDTGVQNGNPC